MVEMAGKLTRTRPEFDSPSVFARILGKSGEIVFAISDSRLCYDLSTVLFSNRPTNYTQTRTKEVISQSVLLGNQI